MKANSKSMQKYDEEELEILRNLEAGTLKPVDDFKKIMKTHRLVAESTLNKINNNSTGE